MKLKAFLNVDSHFFEVVPEQLVGVDLRDNLTDV
jgi:hypothetical protein